MTPVKKALKTKIYYPPFYRYGTKIILFLLLVFLSHNKANTQQKNFSYFKLCILNENNDILLVKHKGIWELAGKKYVDPRSLTEFTGFMAKEMGVTFDDFRLRGLFTFYYNSDKHPVLFNYYSGRYKSGNLEVPPGNIDIAWFPLEEALKVIPFETMRLILVKMFEEKSYVWGASMHIKKSSPMVVDKVTILQEFYPLSK